MTVLLRIIRTSLLAIIVYGASTWTVVPSLSARNRITLIVSICSLNIIFGYLGLDLVKSQLPTKWFKTKSSPTSEVKDPKAVSTDTDTMTASTEVAEAIRLLSLRQDQLDSAIDDLDVTKASGEAEQGPSPATEPEGFSSW